MIVKCHCKILSVLREVCFSNVDSHSVPDPCAISHKLSLLHPPPFFFQRSAPSHPPKSVSNDTSPWKASPTLQMGFNALFPALTQYLRHTFWHFSHLCCISLDICLSFWTVSSWAHVRDPHVLFPSVRMVPARKVEF